MLLDLAIKTLWRRKLRSALTILGVVIAVQLYLMMNGIMSYYDQDIQRQVSAFAGKVFIQQPMGAIDAGEDFPSMNSSIGMKTASSMLSLDGVDRNTSSSVLFVTLKPASAPNMPPALLVVGIEPGHEKAFLGGIEIEAGSIDLSGPNDVILGENAAQHYGSLIGEKPLGPGDSVSIQGKSFNVVGVLKTASNLYSGAVIMPLATAQDLFNYPDTVSAVILTATRLEKVESIKAAVQEKFPKLKSFNQEDIAENANNMIAMQRKFFTMINNSVILATVMVIMIVVMVTVMEQRKEIGTLRAIGARRGRIFSMVVGQSVLLSVIGGVLALPISIITSNGMGLALSAAETLTVWLTTMGVCILIGILASLLPAWQAIHVEPLEALKF
ncbi:MAG: ABC transporter permease [Sedimentisphaerales bacterium]|nr:ABC transporter permease [Sedimentisphaerales bacterium]